MYLVEITYVVNEENKMLQHLIEECRVNLNPRSGHCHMILPDQCSAELELLALSGYPILSIKLFDEEDMTAPVYASEHWNSLNYIRAEYLNENKDAHGKYQMEFVHRTPEDFEAMANDQ